MKHYDQRAMYKYIATIWVVSCRNHLSVILELWVAFCNIGDVFGSVLLFRGPGLFFFGLLKALCGSLEAKTPRKIIWGHLR